MMAVISSQTGGAAPPTSFTENKTVFMRIFANSARTAETGTKTKIKSEPTKEKKRFIKNEKETKIFTAERNGLASSNKSELTTTDKVKHTTWHTTTAHSNHRRTTDYDWRTDEDVGGGVGGLVLFVLVIAIVCILARRRRRRGRVLGPAATVTTVRTVATVTPPFPPTNPPANLPFSTPDYGAPIPQNFSPGQGSPYPPPIISPDQGYAFPPANITPHQGVFTTGHNPAFPADQAPAYPSPSRPPPYPPAGAAPPYPASFPQPVPGNNPSAPQL